MYQWILLVCRYGVAFTYYGITLNITGFGLNLYLTQFLFAVIEVPMKIGVYFFIEKIGRRSGEMAALVLTGVCLFINLFVPTGNYFFLHLIYILQIYIQYIFFCFFTILSLTFTICHPEKWIARTVIAVLGKALSESSFTIIFLYTAELYPTVVRSVFAHLGGRF